MGCCFSAIHSSIPRYFLPRRSSVEVTGLYQGRSIDILPPNTPLKPYPANRVPTLPSSTLSTVHAGDHAISNKTTWTPELIERERAAFFDTRVSGSPEVWATIKLAVDMIREGHIDVAQMYMDVVECTCPTGNIWCGLFDRDGVFYDVPEWVVGAIGERGIEDKKADSEKAWSLKGQESKGKEKIHGKTKKGELVEVRVRLSNGASDIVVKVGLLDNVSDLIMDVERASHCIVKLAYLGKVLCSHDTLEAQGWRKGHLINAFVQRPVE